jgi:hypothetical protein
MIPGSLFCCCYNFLIFGRVHSKTLVQLFEEGIVPFIVVTDCHCISCRNYWQGFDINCQVVAAVGLNYTYWLFCWHLPIDLVPFYCHGVVFFNYVWVSIWMHFAGKGWSWFCDTINGWLHLLLQFFFNPYYSTCQFELVEVMWLKI